MISCGEASGDLYAGALAEQLRRLEPGVSIVGFGGPRLRAAGAHLLADYSAISVTGPSAALRVAPRAFLILRTLIRAAREHRPDVFVAVDFSGFNFRLMAALHRIRIPVVYYVSPQLWAWRSGRMRAMKAHVQRVLVIFPFEKEVYERAGVPVQFVGHPLVDVARPSESREAFLEAHGLDPAAPTVALLPGSRRNELQRLAPVIAGALPRIRARVPGVQFIVARAPGLPDELFEPFLEGPAEAGHDGQAKRQEGVGAARAVRPVFVIGRTDDAIAASDVVITASGTATVQCAVHERPMVVVYRLSPFEYRLGKRFVKVDTYAMPNLIAGRRIVPELIQDDCTPQRVADEAIALLTDRAKHAAAREALAAVRRQLGSPGASARAASAVLAVLTASHARE
jgi:lipid-A-disaccharide synthase